MRVCFILILFAVTHLLSDDSAYKDAEVIQFSFGVEERQYTKDVKKKVKENGKTKRIVVKEKFSAGAEILDMKSSSDGSIYITGVIHGKQSIPKADKTHFLGKGTLGDFSCFAAKLSPDGTKILWFSALDANSLVPSRMVIGDAGEVFIGGTYKEDLKNHPAVHKDSNFKKSKVVIIKISADGAKLDWIRNGGPNQSALTGMCLDKMGNIVWTGSPSGQKQASYVLKMDTNGNYLNWANAGKGGSSSWAVYLHDNDEQIKKSFTSFYIKGDKDGFDYDGDKKWGKVKFWRRCFRLGGQVICLKDGDLIVTSSYFYYFKEGKNKGYPAFDAFIARYSPEGKLKWSSNLYQDGDSVHTPDQKPIDLAYDEKTDSIYALFKQHGSNHYRFKGKLIGDTGNMMISWLGKINAKTGKLSHGWYFQNNNKGKYDKKGLPASPPYPQLAGNRITRIAIDEKGLIYLTGSGAAKMWTSPNAMMSWPDDQSGGGQGALIILNKELECLYATCIGSGKSDCSASFNGIVINKFGVFIGGSLKGTGFHKGKTPPWSIKDNKNKRASMVNIKWKK